MLLRQELFTLNKNRKNGGGRKKSQILLYAGWDSTQAGSKPELGRLTFESHMYSGIEAQKREQFSFAPWIKKGNPTDIKGLFNKVSPEV